MRRTRAFTLVELLIVTTITAVLMAALWTWVGDHRSELAYRDAELAWRGQAATALSRIADDARGAQRVLVKPDGLVLANTGLEDVTYTLTAGTLSRQGPDGLLTLAGGVRRFTAVREGQALTVHLDFEQRFGPYKAEGHHQTVVALRVQP
jgi:prepilin-type N-terminal cleavage/methylation domain-containing protein